VTHAPSTATNEVEAARKSARQLVFAVSAVAFLAMAAGLTGHSAVAFWCLPIVLALGVAANAKTQEVRRVTRRGGAPTVARQIGEGVLLSILALFFVALLFVLWFWHTLGQWHG
jgi:hypothetical protein